MENLLLKTKVENYLTSLPKELKEHIQAKGKCHFLSFHGNEENIYDYEQYCCNLTYVDKMNGERRLSSIYINHCLDIWENPKSFITNLKEIRVMLENHGCPSVGSTYMGHKFATSDTSGWCYRVTLGINYEGFICGEKEHYNKSGKRVHCETIVFFNEESANKWYKKLIDEVNPLGLKSYHTVMIGNWQKRVEQSQSIGKEYRAQIFLTLDQIKNMSKNTKFNNEKRSIEKIWINEKRKYGWKVTLLAKKYKKYHQVFEIPEEALLAYNQGKFSKK